MAVRTLVCAAFLFSVFPVQNALAMQAMEDEQMADVSGAGLAFVLDDFRFQAGPTSYIEQVGGAPAVGTSFNRGDLRWFGATISSGGTDPANLATWSGSCDNGLNSMGCPMGVAGIDNFGNHDNPYVLRVFDYTRVGLDGGDWIGGIVDPVSGVSAGGVNRTVLEILAPSNMDIFRWAFWGEIQASTANPDGSINTILGTLQNQNIIRGKAAARLKPPSIAGTSDASNPFDGPVLQLFQNQSDQSLGLLYQSRLSGDYRMSVNQIVAGPDGDGVPRFTNEEGLYFTNVSAYLPLGILHYQSVVLDDINPGSSGGVGNGNFVIELTRLPNDSNAFNDAYSISGEAGYQRAGRSDRYYQTHGYVEWGDGFPTCAAANCMSGTGVSSVRFAGPGAPGLPALTINSTNFPGNLCGNNRDQSCDRYSGTAAAINIPSSTRAQVVGAGGISFVSRQSGATWNVVHNQNRPVLTDASNTGIRLARTAAISYYSAGCQLFRDCRELVASTPNPPALTDVPFNPVLQVDAINLGSSRVEGLMVQHLKITSLGAGL